MKKLLLFSILTLVSAQTHAASYTITIPTGWSLIANQLDNGGNTLNEVFPVMPDNTVIHMWNCTGYESHTFSTNTQTWTPNGLATLKPGEGAYIVNNSGVAFNHTFTGTPHVPVLPLTLPCGCGADNLVSRQTNGPGTFENIMGVAPTAGTELRRFNGSYSFNGSVWSPSAPTVNIGESVWIIIPCATNSCITFPCALDKTAECDSGWSFDTPVAYDSCCGSNVTVTEFSTTNFGTCPQFHTRTWKATDCSNVVAFCSQTITVVDTTPPVFSDCPTNKTVQCEENWTFGAPTAYDTCCASNPAITILTTITNLTFCPFTYTRIWRATDCCFNSATCTQIVTVSLGGSCVAGETWAPRESNRAWNSVASSADGSKLVAGTWGGQIYTSTDSGLTWTPRESNRDWFSVASSADGSKLVAVVESGQIYTSTDSGLTWTPRESIRHWFSVAASADGSKLVAVVNYGQIYTSTDSGLTWTPRESNRDWASVASSTDGTKLVAVDGHGQIYTSGLMFNCAPDKTVDCGTSWRFDPPTPAGKCYTNLQIAILDTRTNGICPQVITRTWMVIDDCCGNTNTCSQTVTAVDTTPPVIVFCPPDKTNECGANWEFDRPFALDACCPTNSLNYWLLTSNLVFSSQCQTVWEGYWQVSDCCSNYSTICTQRVTVVDTTPPVFSNCPTNNTVECGTNWAFGNPVALDTCCLSNVTVLNYTNLNACASTYTRIWQALDCCFNSSSCTQIVTVVDTTPPVITCATNKTIECGATLTFDPPTAVDACCPSNSLVPELINRFLVSSDACRKVWAGVWRVSDCCPNYSAICTQYVVVVDTIAPSFVPNCPTNMVLPCTGANGRTVDFTVSAYDYCDTNIAVICTPLSGSFFRVGTNVVTCTTRDACGNTRDCTFTITIQDDCPSNSCITITCPPNLRLPCEGVDGTVVNWTLHGSNTCVSGAVTNWSDPPSGTQFGLGTYTITCYASNTLGGEVRTCTFTVEIFPEAPALLVHYAPGLLGTNDDRIRLEWRAACGEFGFETIPGLGQGGSGGGSGWSPISGLPIAHWTRENFTNNAIDRFLAADIPLRPVDPPPNTLPSPPQSFFRLSSDPSLGKDFSSLPVGPYTNPPSPPSLWPPNFTISAMAGGSMEVMDFSVNLRALRADDRGIVAFTPTNIARWPNILVGAPALHEVEVIAVGYVNNPAWLTLKAFDTAGQLVDVAIRCNAYSTVTLRSRGFPLQRIEVVAEPNETGGIVSIKGRPRPLANPNDKPAGDCLDFTSFPTNTVVPNPWELPGYKIGSTNSSGEADSPYIEAGPAGVPDGFGNGYHVEYSATITMTTNCCDGVKVELVTYSTVGVQVQGFNGAGDEVPAPVVTETGRPVTVEFPPSTDPICRIVVTAPDDQTRILRICCLPAIPTIPPPTWCPGTNSNPLVTGCNSNVTEPVTFQLVSGGLLTNLLYTYLFPHNGFTVFDLGTESLVIYATPCDKVVFDVFSESANSGMEFEAVDEFGFTVSRAGPLSASQSPQTVLVQSPQIQNAPLIKAVRIKSPDGQGYMINAWGLPR